MAIVDDDGRSPGAGRGGAKAVQARVAAIVERLEKWPDVSGAKPLRGGLAGSYRVRTGDYRVAFSVHDDVVRIWKIGYRGDVCD